ncbi:hypothetical protein L9F63_016640 [Diploptera punctata]|uniref:Ionotropic glutamate receptor C-terminal domain-containing protein n=1 Tax=Diploptera punctata TaxID=6984 RepID=A0AAD8A0R3_DIPPU|nr:hypothetical protein L9F63_016640 [Diploptera punctata]
MTQKKQYITVPGYHFSIHDYNLRKKKCRFFHQIRNKTFNHMSNILMKYIQSFQSWTLTVHDMTTICGIDLYKKFNAFIFILKSDELDYIRSNEKLLSNLSMNKAKIIVIITGVTSQINVVFQFLDKYSLRQTIVLHEDENRLSKAISWIPDECGDLKEINILGICKHTKYFARKIKYEYNYLNSSKKCQFQLTGLHNPPFSVIDDEGLVIEGIELRLLQLIASHLNLELKHNNTFKSTKEFALGYHVLKEDYINSVTFMERYYTQSYTLFVLKPKSHLHWSNVARTFKLSTWICVVLSLTIISIALTLLDFIKRTGFVKCFLDSLAVFLNVSVAEKPQITRMRQVFFSWVLFSIAFTTVFQAYITSFFTEPGRAHQIDTLQEVEESNMKLALLHRYPPECSYILKGIRSEFMVFQDDCDMLKFCFHNPNTACFTNEEAFLYNSHLYFKHISKSAFYKLNTDGVSVHRTLNMFTTSPHLSLVNQATKRLVEAGIVDKIVESFVDPSGWTRGVRMQEHSPYDYISLSTYHMLSPFIYLSVGLFLSCVVFTTEVIFSVFPTISDRMKLFLSLFFMRSPV